MMDGFEGLGLAPELIAGVETLGWNEPTRIQADAVPVLRRGNNAVLHASAGSGVTGAWGLALLDRLLVHESEDAPTALVLTADQDTATRVAESLARIALPTDLAVRALGPGWTDGRADVLVLTPSAATAALRSSKLKLGQVIALVLHGLDAIDDAGLSADLETVVDAIPTDAQRVVATGRFDAEVNSFLERHVRKAMNVPPRASEDATSTTEQQVRYVIASEREKPAVLVTLMERAPAGEVAVVCRTADRAEALEQELAARGARARSGRLLVLPRGEADQRSTRAEVIAADVPFDADGLADLLGRGGTIVITPREHDHLRRIASRAGVRLEGLPDPIRRTGAAEDVRNRIRSLLLDDDLAPELALLEPLLEEHPAAEVAAAALRLGRADRRAAAERAGGTAPQEPTVREEAAAGSSAPPPEAPTWTHLFVSIGKRDGVGPGDLLGAMTGEAGIEGDQVGKIDIRESHTTVEVATSVARKVIEALNGRTMKGRSLRVDYDRKSRGARPGGSTPSGRRGGGRPGGRPG